MTPRNSRSGRSSATLLIAVLTLIALGATHLCCTADEEAQFAQDHPGLSPTTRSVETVQSTIDPLAVKAQRAAAVTRQAADDAAQLGVPGASVIALIAGAVGTVLGVYNERRRGTTPLNAAITQIVRSVEAAFPRRSDSQKLAMASIQDQATRRIVESIKSA